MFLYEWIIYEFQVSVCSEFIENIPLNMKNITTYFWYNSKRFQNPEDRIGEFKWSESLSQCITSVLWLFWAHFSYFVSPKSPYYFTVLIYFTSSFDASCPRCWRQTTTKELPGNSVWFLNCSSIGLLLHRSVSSPHSDLGMIRE